MALLRDYRTVKWNKFLGVGSTRVNRYRGHAIPWDVQRVPVRINFLVIDPLIFGQFLPISHPLLIHLHQDVLRITHLQFLVRAHHCLPQRVESRVFQGLIPFEALIFLCDRWLQIWNHFYQLLFLVISVIERSPLSPGQLRHRILVDRLGLASGF